MKNIKIFLLAFLVTFGFTASADFGEMYWEYQSRVDMSGANPGQYVSLDLPPGVFEKLRSDLGDLRIVNEGGEVPYALATESEKSFYAVLPAKMSDLGTVLGQMTSFIADIGKSGVLHSRVTIETSSENFKRSVEVYASDDRQNWQLLTGKGQIFDLTNRDNGYLHAHFTTVSYPESARRYLRVVISDLGEMPLNVSGASVAREVTENAREITYSPSYDITEDQKYRTTDIIADLGSVGIPTSGGVLKTSGDIFSRGIRISESNDKNTWTTIGSGYIFSIDTPKFAGSNFRFSYGESRKRFIKISVLNGDDRPLKFDGVNLYGVVRRVVFKYELGKNFDLYLGNPVAVKPDYDIEKFSEYLDAENLGKATAGAVEENKEFVAPEKSFTEKFPQALTVALVLIVLLLLGLVVRLFTSVK